MHVRTMSTDIDQLKRNRAKVFMIAAGLFLLGSQGPDMSDFFAGRGADHREARISVEADHVGDAMDQRTEYAERAFDRAIEMTEHAAAMADHAERLAADAADRAERAR